LVADTDKQPLRTEDYPALYQSADSASTAAQTAYLRCIKAYAALAIVGAALASIGIESRVAALSAAAIFLGGLFLSILIAVKRYEDTWYRTRAIAESIKTTCWRFMMGAEPFDHILRLNEARQKLTHLLRRILQEHKHLAGELAGNPAEKSQITETMIRIRELTLDERRQVYRRERINEQRQWYAGRSKTNTAEARKWFVVLVLLQGGAISFVLLRVAFPDWKFWPTEMFVVAAASTLGWMQVKRFRELTAAYALTAHEIGLADAELGDMNDEPQFSRFVGDAENAFSREHTQWVARKD
jgi:ABC-type transport system involved in cytochrome bd biosynthesis fused ATPase/permease subunit